MEISLVRRGSHVLVQQGKPAAYLESAAIQLRAYEHQPVTVRGVFEPNIDLRDMPVLIVQEVVAVDVLGEQMMTASALRIRLHIPPHWRAEDQGDLLILTASGASAPAIRMFASRDPLPEGLPLLVGGRSAVRILDEETGEQRVLVRRGNGETLHLVFMPSSGVAGEQERSAWIQMLHTLTFTDAPRAPAPVTGSGGGACGGAAGILCPAGQFCAIADPVTNTGVCRVAGR